MNQLTAENLSYEEVNDSSFIKNFKSVKKISEILHEAADVHLEHPRKRNSFTVEYSCIAILLAMTKNLNADYDDWVKHSKEFKRIKRGLMAMGLKVSRYSGSGTVFSKINDCAKRQEARYDWLKLAALMAEEQGV